MTITAARFATGTVNHAAEMGVIACGAGTFRKAGEDVRKTQARHVAGEVTCKRCLTFLDKGWRGIEVSEVAAPAPERTRSALALRALKLVEEFAELAETADLEHAHNRLTIKLLSAEQLALTAQVSYAEVKEARRRGIRRAMEG